MLLSCTLSRQMHSNQMSLVMQLKITNTWGARTEAFSRHWVALKVKLHFPALMLVWATFATDEITRNLFFNATFACRIKNIRFRKCK